MKMSTKGRYAVMAMIDIGQHSGGNPVSLSEIAGRQDISQLRDSIRPPAGAVGMTRPRCWAIRRNPVGILQTGQRQKAGKFTL